MAIGLIIFFIYWSARTFYATDLTHILFFGLIWLLLSILGSIVGLFLLGKFIYQHYPKYMLQSMFGVFMILISYPIVVWILNLQEDMNKRAYVEIINATLVDRLEVSLISANLQKNVGTLDCSQSTTICYYPEYLDDSDLQLSPYFIVVQCHDTIFKLEMPRIDAGKCAHLKVHEEMKLMLLTEEN